MFCGHCGVKREKIERFCTECGKEQLQESLSAPEPPSVYEVNHEIRTTPVPEINQGTFNNSTLDGFAISNEELTPQGEMAAHQEPTGGDNKKAIGIIATIFAGLALLIGVGLFLIFGASEVEVPDLSNLTQDEAISLIEESRLTVGEITEEYSRRVEAGLVISQSLRAGREVERGTSIDLTISLGAELVEIPDFTNLELLDAADIVRELGLTLVVVEEFSETAEDGIVISQSIPAGGRIEVGESIDLVVSLGPESVTVPDFTGLTIDEVAALFAASNLRLGRVYEDYDDDLEEGLVISQSLRVGSLADPGDSVDLVISLGARPPSASPFNLDVWGEDQSITLELGDVSVDVPIPTWLNDVIDESLNDENHVFDDRVRGFVSTGRAFYVMNRERDDLKTMIEVSLSNYFGDFEEAAEDEVYFIALFLEGLEYNYSVTTRIFYEGRGELTAGISIFEYPEDGSDQLISVFELVKINEYNGIMITTRLRLRTVDAPEGMCSDEFAYAFGLWRYIDGGFIAMDP